MFNSSNKIVVEVKDRRRKSVFKRDKSILIKRSQLMLLQIFRNRWSCVNKSHDLWVLLRVRSGSLRSYHDVRINFELNVMPFILINEFVKILSWRSLCKKCTSPENNANVSSASNISFAFLRLIIFNYHLTLTSKLWKKWTKTVRCCCIYLVMAVIKAADDHSRQLRKAW